MSVKVDIYHDTRDYQFSCNRPIDVVDEDGAE
jgi:hypothetical protein